MKKANLQMSRTKKKFMQYVASGKKAELYWSLTQEQAEFIRQQGFPVIPWLYEMKTRKFPRISETTDPLIKNLHYANKRGKKYFTTRLNEKQLNLLEELKISTRIVKYKIVLSEKRC